MSTSAPQTHRTYRDGTGQQITAPEQGKRLESPSRKTLPARDGQTDQRTEGKTFRPNRNLR